MQNVVSTETGEGGKAAGEGRGESQIRIDSEVQQGVAFSWCSLRLAEDLLGASDA